MTKPKKNQKAAAKRGSARKGSAQTKASTRRQYMIRVATRGGSTELNGILAKLRRAGVQLDERYGTIPIDKSGEHFVVRGWAEDESREQASKIPSVQFFGDAAIEHFGPE
jgi:hypothetical protein